MIMLFLLAIAASLYCLRIFFTLATQALPVYAGLSAALLLHHAGLGVLLCAVLGLGLGACVLGLGRHLIVQADTSPLRRLTLVFFLAPAGLAGYQLMRSLGTLVSSNAPSLTGLGLLGGVIVAHSTWQGLRSLPVS